ncbi:MAG: hypothetical protein ABI134_14395 [Byssovorax sp.]
MIKESTGPDPAPTEAELLAGWSEPKTAISNLADGGALRSWDPTDFRDVERLRATLHDRWLVVTLFPGPLTFFTLRRHPAPVSRHGPLLPYEEPRYAVGMPHAVVLVEALETDGFRYLDPYYPVDGQPFSLTDDELMEAWTGVVLIPTLPIEIVEAILES